MNDFIVLPSLHCIELITAILYADNLNPEVIIKAHVVLLEKCERLHIF